MNTTMQKFLNSLKEIGCTIHQNNVEKLLAMEKDQLEEAYKKGYNDCQKNLNKLA